MEKKDEGNWLIIGGSTIFIIGSLLWVILFLIFKIISAGFYMGLIAIPTLIGLCCIIIGCLIIEKKRKRGIMREKRHRITGVVFIILGLYIFLVLMLIDSPTDPPILGPSNMNVDMLDGLFLAFMFGSVFTLILSGVELSLSSSKRWLGIGLVVLVISVGIFQFWVNGIIIGYERMMHGPPGPLI